MGALASLKVLVVGINYAPEHSGIAPYTTQACKHFVAEGADVLVLAGVPHYPHWSTPEPYRGTLRVDETINGVAVRRLRHVVPSTQSAATRGAYEASFAAQVIRQRLPWSPDVVLTVVPSLLSAASAAVIAKRCGARLVVWVQDLMGPAASQSGIVGGRSVARLTTAIEQSILRRADMVLVLNDSFRTYVVGAGVEPSRVVTARNWSHGGEPSRDRAGVRDQLGWQDGQVVALHTGNMGLKQGLENVIEAARLAQTLAPHVRFVLMGEGSQRNRLRLLAAGITNLDMLAPVRVEEYPDVLAAADVLLLNENGGDLEMSLPSKLTSYFEAGGPIVAAVRAGGGSANEIRASGAGVVVQPGSPAALLSAVLEAAEAPRELSITAARRHVRRHLLPEVALTRLTGVLLDVRGLPANA